MHKRFVKGMILYAVIFLLITAGGLAVFWNFIDAYEQSRPVNTVKAYVAQLTDADFCNGSGELLAQLDSNIQSEEEACQVILNSLEQDLSYAKKSGESSEARQTYVLRCGRQAVGQFVITAGEPDFFGFRVWEVTEESFDFSHLMAQAVTVTVPADYSVSINGRQLDSSYITDTEIPYGTLEDFYDDYALPSMVSYSADGFLGELALEVTDQDGNPVEITDETDLNMLLPGCTQEEAAELESFTGEFLKYYMIFTGSYNRNASLNYTNLKQYLVPDSELAQRLYTAIDGLNYAQSYGDTLQEITINQVSCVGENLYFCDVTYIVETIGKKGAVDTTNNLKLMIVNTDSGLKVESMTRY